MPYLDYLDSDAYRETESKFVAWQKIPTLFILDIILICASLLL
jgi:MFS family permease